MAYDTCDYLLPFLRKETGFYLSKDVELMNDFNEDDSVDVLLSRLND